MDSFDEDEAIAAQQAAEREERRRRRVDLREVLATPAGRRFVYRLINDDCGLCARTYAGELTHATAFAEGKRSVGAALDDETQRFAPAAYREMMLEQLERARDIAPEED